MSLIYKNQKGFTLIELLIALGITGLVVASASSAIIPILQSTNTSAHMIALRQVQTAGYWVSRDSLQAYIVEDDDSTTLHIDVDDLATAETEILILKWTDRDSEAHEVTYKLVGDVGELKQLQRVEKVGDTVTTTIVGTNIDDNETSCDWTSDENEAFNFKVKAEVSGARGPRTETRTYKIQPRPDQIP
jgi:prepilin-type N-terminal cleavage/methylation domain-containing protein